MAEQVINVLGPVAIKHMGEYNPATNYEKLNAVTYEGSTYCANTSTIGNLPTDTDYWSLMAEKGDKGDMPVKGVDYYTQEDISDLEATLSNDVQEEVIRQIGTISDGTPIPASSVSGMTDTTRLYVNTTDGYVYYNDGTDWIQGWVYQATSDPEVVDTRKDNYNNTFTSSGLAVRKQVAGQNTQSLAIAKESLFPIYFTNFSDNFELLGFDSKEYRATSTGNWKADSYLIFEAPVTPGEKIHYGYFKNNGLSTQITIAYFLDENDTEISHVNTGHDQENKLGMLNKVVTVPNGTVKMRVRFVGIGNASTYGQTPVVGEVYYTYGAFMYRGETYFNEKSNDISFEFWNRTKVPNYDKSTRQLTIYTGTTYINRTTNYTYVNNEDIVLNWDATNNVSINKLFFDESTNTYELVRYNVGLTSSSYKNKVLLGSLERDGLYGYLKCGYTINGVVANLGLVGYDNLTDDLKERINRDVENIPSDWLSKVQTIQDEQKGNFSFAIQTDNHYYLQQEGVETAGYNLKELTNRVAFDFVANLGDIIRGYSDATIDTTDNMKATLTELMRRYSTAISCPFLATMGNHDNNVLYARDVMNDPSYLITTDDFYSRVTQITKNTCKNAVFDGRSVYYYVDFDDIRVIVLNTTDGDYTQFDSLFKISNKQLTWFENVALNTDKKLIIMTHTPLVSQLTTNTVTNRDVVMNDINNFINNGGEVIGFFYGHQHEQNSTVVDGIPHICFKNGSNVAEAVIIDTNEKTIKTIGIGSGISDRTFSYN